MLYYILLVYYRTVIQVNISSVSTYQTSDVRHQTKLSLIHWSNSVTLVKMPGAPIPHLLVPPETTPTICQGARSSSRAIKGPPLSPLQLSLPSSPPAQRWRSGLKRVRLVRLCDSCLSITLYFPSDPRQASRCTDECSPGCSQQAPQASAVWPGRRSGFRCPTVCRSCPSPLPWLCCCQRSDCQVLRICQVCF